MRRRDVPQIYPRGHQRQVPAGIQLPHHYEGSARRRHRHGAGLHLQRQQGGRQSPEVLAQHQQCAGPRLLRGGAPTAHHVGHPHAVHCGMMMSCSRAADRPARRSQRRCGTIRFIFETTKKERSQTSFFIFLITVYYLPVTLFQLQTTPSNLPQIFPILYPSDYVEYCKKKHHQ